MRFTDLLEEDVGILFNEHQRFIWPIVCIHAEQPLIYARCRPGKMPLPPKLDFVVACHSHHRFVARPKLHRSDADGLFPIIPVL